MTKAKAIKLFTEIKTAHNLGILSDIYKTSIYEVYKNPSRAKQKAWVEIIDKTRDFNYNFNLNDEFKYSTRPYIYGANDSTFSAFYLIVGKTMNYYSWNILQHGDIILFQKMGW